MLSFTTLIVQPLFNLLVFIYALIPGHNFGLSLIIFTIIIRILLWPLVKKQLHQTKAMRKLQPELKKVKKAAKGDRQKEQQLMMELYKERGINPFATFPILIVQIIVLFGLYLGLTKVLKDNNSLVTFAYPFLQNLGWMQELGQNIHRFDNTLFGIVDLSRPALGPNGGIYFPALLLVAGSAFAQYMQSRQLMPVSKDQRTIRSILKEANDGKQADTSEISAAVGRFTIVLLPVTVFIFTIHLASALSLYWFTGALVAILQQGAILRQDDEEMEVLADAKPKKDVKVIPEAEVVEKPAKPLSAAEKSALRDQKRRKTTNRKK